MSEFLDAAKQAALASGNVLMKHYGKNNNEYKKKDNSYASDADLKAETAILNLILKKFPDHAYYSEEKGRSDNISKYCWYIDPLDGTHNFIRGIPFFGTSIALAKDDEFILGVIYVPYLKELFWAEKGSGAYMNNEKIKVSNNALSKSIFAAPSSVSYNGLGIAKISQIFIPRIFEIRMIGSAAIGLAYTAKGRFDFYIKPGITPYDTGAGKVILEEAGGKLTETDGSKFTTKGKSFIASNNLFHDKLIEIMKEEYLK